MLVLNLIHENWCIENYGIRRILAAFQLSESEWSVRPGFQADCIMRRVAPGGGWWLDVELGSRVPNRQIEYPIVKHSWPVSGVNTERSPQRHHQLQRQQTSKIHPLASKPVEAGFGQKATGADNLATASVRSVSLIPSSTSSSGPRRVNLHDLRAEADII